MDSGEAVRPEIDAISDEAPSRERPSRHGMILGQFLSEVAEAGRQATPERASLDMCSTCAFREGSMPNRMAATGLVAFNCVMGIDTDRFACHHGMRDGNPTKLCVGYLLASSAPWPEIQAESTKLRERLDAVSGPDEVREAFERWLDKVDADRALDDYALARLFARDAARPLAASLMSTDPQSVDTSARPVDGGDMGGAAGLRAVHGDRADER